MRHMCMDEDQRAALWHLRCAQLTEARCIRRVVVDGYLLRRRTSARPAGSPHVRRPVR